MRPPFHGNQIAEPLVGELMRYDKGHPLLVGSGRMVIIHQESALTVRNGAPVFHRTACEIRYGYHVESRQGVCNIKIFFVKLEGLYSAIQSKFCLMFFPESGKNSYEHPGIRFSLDMFQVSDNKSQKIRRHLRGRGEFYDIKSCLMFPD